MTRRWNLILVAGLVAALPVALHAAKDDAALATHAMATLDGAPLRLADLRGEVVIVNFWATWCAPCHDELKTLDTWHRAWAGRDARVVAISIDESAVRVKRYASDLGLALTVVHDGPDGLAASLDLPSVPCTFLLDRDGRVVRVVKSSSIEALTALRAEAESLMAARPRTQEAGMGSATPGVPTDARNGDGR